ncbi:MULTISPECIES: phage DNA ejection protein [unclassified Providencia]|uniref:phage DNA ejection protein n=1 Tax=unclassified Providencia TaxID=2633465 RepID=UPI00234930A4|nr:MULTISPECIES: phage DNA ejection protein [unclassified Providencia]
MATWNQNINSGGFLGGIGKVNDNAPRASDINPTLGLIRENNDLQRSGANNWGLQGLAGLSGVAQVMNEQKQQERLKEFQGKWGQAMANNDTDTMKGLFAEYPEMEAQIGKGMEGINADVRKSMSDLALGYHAAVVSGKPEEFIRANADKMRQYGFDPQVAMSMAKENPNAAREYAVGLGMMAEGSPELFINKVNNDANREIERDKLAEDARQADMTNARGWANIKESQLDRAQRAQIHSDNMGVKMIELSQKQAESGKIDPKLVQSINKDIDSFNKNYSAMYGAAKSLEALGERNTPAAQLGMIFNYMKSLDPQSVVREGEQVQVKRTDGIFGTMGNYVTQLSNGKMLNDDQVKDLIGTSKVLANTEGEKFNQTMDSYFDTYGDSLPTPLVKRFDSRKAKLFDIPKVSQNQPAQQASKANLSPDDEALLNKYLQE